MWKKIKDFLFYATLDKKQFSKVTPLVASENALSIELASIVEILYFGVSLFSSWGVESMADKKLVYGIGTAIPVLVLIVYFLFGKKHQAVIPWLVRILCVGIFATGLLCTLVCTPDEMTILLLIFFFCVPMIFAAAPWELIALVIVTDAIYFSLAPFLKTSDVLSMDILDVAIFSTLSMILGGSHLRGRYKCYWLETSAVDLAEIRYQAAFIDQLTDTFNRNAYNKDTEEMGDKKIDSGFMFLTVDINGLKSANDTFGHVAGDELIIGAAKCLKKSFDSYGKVYRVGGDEYNIVANIKDVSEGDILRGFNQNVDEWHGAIVKKLSVSYGVVMGNEAAGLSFHEIELLADRRMYQAKSDYYKNAGLDRRRG